MCASFARQLVSYFLKLKWKYPRKVLSPSFSRGSWARDVTQLPSSCSFALRAETSESGSAEQRGAAARDERVGRGCAGSSSDDDARSGSSSVVVLMRSPKSVGRPGLASVRAAVGVGFGRYIVNGHS